MKVTELTARVVRIPLKKAIKHASHSRTETENVSTGENGAAPCPQETPVSKFRVNAFSISADGFGAGPDQSRDEPLGRGGEQLHQWFLPTRTF